MYFGKLSTIIYTTPEPASAIDSYIKYRERYGEKISEESPLFREEFNIDNPIVVKSPKKVYPNVLGDQIRVNIYRSGIFEQQPLTEGQKPGQRRYAIPRAHGFCKFFETNLIRSKVLEPIPELLLNHKSEIGLKKHYLRLTAPGSDFLMSFSEHLLP